MVQIKKSGQRGRIQLIVRMAALGLLAGVLAAGPGTSALAQPATGDQNSQRQERFQRTGNQPDGGPRGRMGGGGPGGQWWRTRDRLTDQEIYRMAEYLHFDDGQVALASAMFQSFDQAYQAEVDTSRDRLDQARQEARDSGQWMDMMSRMIELGVQSEKRAAALENSFLQDVHDTVLSEEQQAQWASYERDRRRRATLKQGAQIAGEGVDLYEVLDNVDLEPEARQQLSGTLDSYSIELDHALVERNQFVSDVMSNFENVLSDEDGQDPEAVFRKQTEKREAIRKINANYAQLIADQIGGAEGRAFLDEFNQTAYPQVYNETAVEPYAEQLKGLQTLSDSQVERVNAIYSDYQERMRNLNKQLVTLQNKQEQERQRMMFEGMRMMYTQGPQALRQNMQNFWRDRMQQQGQDAAQPSDPMDLLRREKRDLESTTLDAFSAVLSADQLAEAPRPQPEAERERRQQEREQRIQEWRQRMQDRGGQGGRGGRGGGGGG